ncbi:NADPH-dependent FMN reductase [Brevibacterium otitidis]|uniref:NADPH-dependent FMN reductase n=1 Tax=Brevibacterium otitidis TaxID=53364 RepID=A0ABV5WXU5_9MICO|nr:NADPH-dependent FMN reductase [Brevibacterium otitidis]
MTRIGVIAGSSRPGALNPQVVDWISQQLTNRGVEFEVVNFMDFGLPLLDEEIPSGAHNYQNAHTKKWAAAIAPFDAYIVVTPEYNHSIPGALKNALDYVAVEFANKPIAFSSYGADKGVRAVEAWRLVFSNHRAATVRHTASFSIFTDFADGVFAPTEVSVQPFGSMLADLLAWSEGFKLVRAKAA